jgi:drug/metabolite transporter (DMT)-like permease
MLGFVPKFTRIVREDVPNFKKVWRIFLLTTLIAMMANFLFYYSVSLTKTSYVILVAQFQSFFVLLLMMVVGRISWLRTQESFDRKAILQKMTGFVIMLGGMVLALLT